MKQKTAVIVGAGPAGLTAAYELLHKTDIKPVVFEMTEDIGGISKTVNYKGNRLDIGGHRFFSKSDRVMQWWFNLLPLQGAPSKDDIALSRKVQLSPDPQAPDPEKTDRVMLLRRRVSRILYMRKFFDYPVSMSFNTISNLGPIKMAKIGASYIYSSLFPIKKENSLEDFFVNRFGKELYNTFFKDYTEKVWGVACNAIKPEWGAQRVKGLSILKLLWDAAKQMFFKDTSLSQQTTETTLIKQFFYPKYGPGQMWEEAARIIKAKGGEIYNSKMVFALKHNGSTIVEVSVRDTKTGQITTQQGDYFFSTMPVKDLIFGFDNTVPREVKQTAQNLRYRDFIVVGLLLKKLKLRNETKINTINNIIPDNWIYIQEKEVKLGRLQIFNNWSPYMVRDENNVWIGLEYFCNEGDELWDMVDKDFISFAINELAQINVIDKQDVLDSTLLRMPKTYPAYFGSYESFHIIRKYLDTFENLFLIGRNGMHRYNNQDHSMLTAITAVENIVKDVRSKDNIWDINTEEEYHELKVNEYSSN
jgi:protoporphyrinogen oxidase